MSEFAITRDVCTGGLLRRVQINDGPWFVRVGEESDIVRLTKANAELREAFKHACQAAYDEIEPVGGNALAQMAYHAVKNELRKALANSSEGE